MNPLKAAAAAFLLAALGCAGYLLWLPDVRPLKTQNPRETSFMRLKEAQAAKAGKKVTRRMQWARWDEISDNLKHAVLVAEDDMFYAHKGVNWETTREAFRFNLGKKKFARGGSTITQQLARNLYLSPSKNPLRKIKEYLIARRLERELGKRRIFELYLNVAEWGKGIYGAQAASLAYFGRTADTLTPEEAAALAAVLPSPRRYDPLKDSRFMRGRKSTIVARMRASGYLPDEEETGTEEGPDEELFDAAASSAAPAGAGTEGPEPAPAADPGPLDGQAFN